jgi:2-desacetyl-2-hydroxyethyl bacteriochlorophyllide A dehydrogenase
MNTRAVVFTEKNKIEIQELELAQMGDNDVLVDIEYSFISPGTERWCLTGQFHDGVYEDGAYNYPFVPGYQYGGRVKNIGRNVSGFKPGDRVFGQSSRFKNMTAMWGGHCGLSLTAAAGLYHVPDNVSLTDAAALVIAQVGYNGGSRPPVDPGDVAVVIGDGLIGQFAAQTLRMRGAYTIIVGKGDKKRLDLARKYSCDQTIDTVEQSLKDEILKVVPEGPRIIVEAIGIHDYAKVAADLLADQGHFVLNGFYPNGNPIDMNLMCGLKEITVHNPSSMRRERMEKTLELISLGKLNVGSLITHKIKDADAPAAYEDMVLKRNKSFMGIVIDWHE